jgi:repressor LexA
MKEKILAFIQQYISENKYAPTVREICRGVGLKSTDSGFHYMHKLRNEGKIHFIDCLPRTISVL